MTIICLLTGRFCLPVLIAFSLFDCGRADVAVPHIFNDNMVLQRDKPVRIWGWADPRETVTVQFADQTKTIAADTDGTWAVELEPMAASFEPRAIVVKGKANTLTYENVLVGELWICGGQSNMEWTLRSTRDADLELASANYPAIRFIRLPHVARLEPQKDFPVESPERFEGNWHDCASKEVDNCTGVGYYFARRLHRRLNVPVGLIDTSWGGTMAQHWVSQETLRPFAQMKPYFDKFQASLDAWIDGGGEEGAKRRFDADMKEWQKQMEMPRAEGEREPRRPNFDAYSNPANKGQPGGMYNGMIAPLAGLTIRGVLFYQGENNSFAESWKPFPKTFPAVIADWRGAFNDESLPIGLIQIAGWSNRRSMTYDMNHHTNIVREVQFNTWQRTKNTGLIVTFDTNSNGSIHPARKLPVGERSARWALAEVYDVRRSRSEEPLQWRGPVYKSMEIVDGKVIVTFEDGTNRGLRLDQDDECGIYIAGDDREFHHARARIDGGKNTLIVWSDDVSEPTAVRYGWSNLPAGGLMNGRELPAYPFRTDRWPMIPHQSTGAYEVE